MPDRFDDEFIKGAAFTEPSHTQRLRRPRRRWPRGFGIATVVIVSAGVLVVAILRGVGSSPLKAADHTTGPGPGSSPSSASSPAEPARPATRTDPADPFAGSPAASYATGAAGIVVPEAKAMGGLSEKRVATAYKKTKRMLEAAGLDRKALLGGSTDRFAGTLEPPIREDFRKDLKSRKRSTRAWLVSFAPRSAELAVDAIKVHGTMSARPARHEGVRGIDVKVDYLFVYAIRRPGRPDTVQRLIARLTGTSFHDSGTGSRYWSFRQGVGATPADCDAPDDGFIRPAFDGEHQSEASGPPIDPYDQAREDTGEDCKRATRT